MNNRDRRYELPQKPPQVLPTASAPDDLPFLAGYPLLLRAQARELIARQCLHDYLRLKYPEAHTVRNDSALYDYVMAKKSKFLRNAPPLAKVVYDNRLQIDHRALGTLTSISRIQGTQLKSKREIRIATLFKDAPATLLKMIIVHELAHLKEREHNKAFYALCEHMLPLYHQVEFDTRLYLTLKSSQPSENQP